MKSLAVLAILVMLTGLAGCSSAPQQSAGAFYSVHELERLTYCFGMTDTVMYTARQKLNQLPEVQLADYYEARPNAKLNLAIVHKVYADAFSNAWDYTLSVFNDCAKNLAGVGAGRVSLANICEQYTLVADVAYSYNKFGYPKEQAYTRFKDLKGKMPKRIVDQVYASDQSRGELKLQVWQSCMKKMSTN